MDRTLPGVHFIDTFEEGRNRFSENGITTAASAAPSVITTPMAPSTLPSSVSQPILIPSSTISVVTRHPEVPEPPQVIRQPLSSIVPDTPVNRRIKTEDIPSAESAGTSAAGQSLIDFLDKFDNYKPTIPDSIVQHYMQTAGLSNADPRVMKIILNKILQILPSIQSSVLESLIKLLHEIGVAAEDELKYVRETDLTGILRPIQARKLIDAWSQSDSAVPVSNTIRIANTTSAANTSSVANATNAANTTRIENTSSVANTTTAANATSAANTTSAEILPSESDTSDSTPSTSSLFQNAPLDWAEDFSIPWSKMSQDLIKALKEGRRPSPKGRREFVNVTTQDIYKICHKPGKKNLEKIAKKAVRKYPSLSDVWCKEIVAGGCDSLTRSLVVKFENLNRRDGFNVTKRSLKRSMNEGDSSNDDTVMKLSVSSQYGCVNWQPRLLPVGEDIHTQQEKQNQMIKISSLLKPDGTLNEYLTLIEATFYSQRKEINSCKNITLLLNSWPLLFFEKAFFHHFELLTGINILQTIQTISATKVPKVINFFKSLPNKKNKISEILDKETSSELEMAISLILEHFNEKKEVVFISMDRSVTAKDVESITTLPRTPCLIYCGDDSVASTYMIAVDAKIISEDINSFESAFFMMFAAYYILNIEYNQMACATLEFVQRCFLKLNPEKGSKASRNRNKHFSKTSKVLTLLNKLMDFEWC